MAEETSPEYEGLRQLWIDGLSETGQQEAGSNGVRGVLMEIGFPQAVVTLATSAGGDASLLFQTGGGIIGGGGHAMVRRAANQFSTVANQFIAQCQPASDYPLPAAGEIRFTIFTKQGVFTAGDTEQAMANQRHEFSPLFYSGNEVITQLRLVSQKEQQTP